MPPDANFSDCRANVREEVRIQTATLYFHKGIPFKASLYALYCIIAVIGYFNWKRKVTA